MTCKPYIKGEYKVMCDICGCVRYASETCLNWKGERVCRDTCFERQNPQDKLKVHKTENRLVKNPRPLKLKEEDSLTDWSKVMG